MSPSLDTLPPGAEIPPDDFDFKLYRYTPSLVGAIVTLAVFAILSAGHLWRLFQARAFYFTAFLIGGLCKFSTGELIEKGCDK